MRQLSHFTTDSMMGAHGAFLEVRLCTRCVLILPETESKARVALSEMLVLVSFVSSKFGLLSQLRLSHASNVNNLARTIIPLASFLAHSGTPPYRPFSTEFWLRLALLP